MEEAYPSSAALADARFAQANVRMEFAVVPARTVGLADLLVEAA
jgi:hypothetical protein